MEDKRTQIRLRIPAGLVKYKNDSGFTFFNQYIGPGALLDISKSGAGFTISYPVKLEDKIKVKIRIPGQKNLILRGQVRWIQADQTSGLHKVGVQFAPYGSRREYNTPKNLSRLGNLSKIYH